MSKSESFEISAERILVSSMYIELDVAVNYVYAASFHNNNLLRIDTTTQPESWAFRQSYQEVNIPETWVDAKREIFGSLLERISIEWTEANFQLPATT